MLGRLKWVFGGGEGFVYKGHSITNHVSIFLSSSRLQRLFKVMVSQRSAAGGGIRTTRDSS